MVTRKPKIIVGLLLVFLLRNHDKNLYSVNCKIVYNRISKLVKGTLKKINRYRVLKQQLFLIKKEFKYIYITVNYKREKRCYGCCRKTVKNICTKNTKFCNILVIFVIMKSSILLFFIAFDIQFLC